MTRSDSDLLALAGALAARAAEAILAIRARGFETRLKIDATPVTEADHAAERLIVEGLRAAADIPVIAEEELAAGIAVSPGREFWLVDPLDGTREFAADRPDYTVNIGLVREGVAVLGAVALPGHGQLYLGRLGAGAVRRDARGEQPIRVRTPPPEGVAVVASRHYADDPQLAEWLAGHRVARLANFGSATKFVRVAEGGADLYPRLGRTMEWDTAAPQAVVEAAGGSVRLFDGTPLRYGKPGWENPPFLCAGA